MNDKVELHKIKAVTEEKVRVKLPDGVKHYYTMEMLDEPECVNKALNFGARIMAAKAMVRLGGLEKYEYKLT